jgi:RimJ/RimL family protein N-acetyltransferase
MILTLHPLTKTSPSDYANVLCIYRESPSYVELHEGRAPAEADADDFFDGKPDSKDHSDKAVYGLYADGEMIGCADLIRGFPTDDCAWIGLLLFSERHRNRGYGKQALMLIYAIAREWGCTKIQIATLALNLRGQAFWQREGFHERSRARNTRFPADLIVMERPVD